MNQPRKLNLSNVIRLGDGELSVQKAYQREKLSPDEQEFFADAILDFEKQMMIEARARAKEDPGPNPMGKPEHVLIAAKTGEHFNNLTGNEAVVKGAIKAYAKEQAERGKYFPEDIFPDIAAEVNAERNQRYAASQARHDDARRGELRNAEIDRRIEDYQKAVRERSGTEPSRNQALCDLRKFEKEVAEYRDLNPEASKAEAKAIVRTTNESFELMPDGGAPYKGQCKEQWYEDELTPRGQQPQEREPELEMAAAMDDGRAM